MLDGIGDEFHRQATAEIGIRRNAAQDGAIDQVPAQPAAQDDAKGHPHHQVADIVLGGGRLAVERRRGPKPLAAEQQDDPPPAQQQARDIGQGVPADGERPQMSRMGSKWG